MEILSCKLSTEGLLISSFSTSGKDIDQKLQLLTYGDVSGQRTFLAYNFGCLLPPRHLICSSKVSNFVLQHIVHVCYCVRSYQVPAEAKFPPVTLFLQYSQQ